MEVLSRSGVMRKAEWTKKRSFLKLKILLGECRADSSYRVGSCCANYRLCKFIEYVYAIEIKKHSFILRNEDEGELCVSGGGGRDVTERGPLPHYTSALFD